jgi:hypothetical protein
LLVAGVPFSARADTVNRVRADRISLPPDRREFRSPSGNYILTLSSADHWQTRSALAELQLRSGSELKPLWHKVLPQEHGPRHVLVLDSGAVVLMDEWINVPSRHALMLLAPDGSELAHYGLDDLVLRLGVSRRMVADHGRLGLWMSSAPALSEDGRAVVFHSAQRRLILRLADGQLTAID